MSRSLVAPSMIVSVLAVVTAVDRLSPNPSRPPAHALGAVLPGITREIVCDPGYAARVRHVTEAQKLRIFRAAGIPANQRSLYEIDHVVPLSLGGSNDDANLSPQLWEGPDGAHAKDRVEYWAYRQVCAGKVTIEDARLIFRTPGAWQETARQVGLASHPSRLGIQAAPIAEPDHDEEGFPR